MNARRLTTQNLSWVVFLLIFVGILTAFRFLHDTLESRYLEPPSIVPKRHVPLAPQQQIEQKLFAESILPGSNFVISKDSFSPAFTAAPVSVSEVVGLRLFTGTYDVEVEINELVVTFHAENAQRAECRTKRNFQVQNNGWNEVRLFCEKDSRIRLSDVSHLSLTFSEIQKDRPLAWYAQKCEGNCVPGKVYPSLDFFVSKLSSDTPQTSFSSRKNHGKLWDDSLFSTVSSVLEFTLALALSGLATLLVRFGRTKKPERRRIESGIVVTLIVLWISLLFSNALHTPPLQYPDEPQHLIGALLNGVGTEDFIHAREQLLEVAARTSFTDVAETRNVPLLEIFEPKKSLGRSDFIASPKNRSYLYGQLTAKMIPFGLSWWKAGKDSVRDIVFFIRSSLMFPSLLLVLASFLTLMAFRRTGSALFLALCLLNPVSLSLYAAISNYGSAIALGAVFMALSIPEGSPKKSLICSHISFYLLFCIAELASPNLSLLFLAPLVSLSLLSWKIAQEPTLQSRRMGLLIFLNYPVAVLISQYLFPGFWEQGLYPRVHGKFSIAFQGFTKLTGLNLEKPDFSSVKVIYEGYALALSAVFGWLTQLLATRQKKPVKPRSVNSNLVLSLLVCSSAFIAIGVLRFVFPLPEYISNIYKKPKPPFPDFLLEGIRAQLSQFVHLEQDYYLWQTNFLANGWLDSTAPAGFYFLLKALFFVSLVGVALAAIWRRRDFVFLVLPSAILAPTYWVLLLYGTWNEGHTLLGRYLLPAWGLFLLPLVMSVALLVLPSRPLRGFALVSGAMCILFGLFDFYSIFWLLPMRFIVGGS